MENSSLENKQPGLQQTDVSGSRFQSAYGEYWDTVRHSVDAEGWVYSKELPHILDFYFEANTGKPIDFQKSYDGEYKGSRWRPKELSSDCR